MKHLKLIFVACCLINILFLPAQNTLVLKDKTGIENSYALSDIQKITFENASLILKHKNLSINTFRLSDVSFLRFGEMTALHQIEDSNITIQFFPNPVKEQLNISYFANSIEDVKLQLININGKIVYENTRLIQSGNNTIILSMSQLQNGLYFCRIQSGNKSVSKLIIKH